MLGVFEMTTQEIPLAKRHVMQTTMPYASSRHDSCSTTVIFVCNLQPEQHECYDKIQQLSAHCF